MSPTCVNCDWGTTHFRLRLVDLETRQIQAEARTDEGVASLASRPAHERADAYRTVLIAGLTRLDEQAGELRDLPVVISGMASSSLGWHELAYSRLPLGLDGRGLTWRELPRIATPGGEHRVLLISGGRTEHDVMRGEETEILGLFQLPAVRGLTERSLVIKPGTHAKHVQIAGGQMVDFRTFMTGELFDILGKHSILRHSMRAEGETIARGHLEHLRAGVRTGRELPLSAAVFRIRTRQLLAGQPPEANRAFASGVLLGAELSYLADADWVDWPLILCAGPAFAEPYWAALDELGLGQRVAAIPPGEVDLASARGQALVWQYCLG